MKIKAIIGKAVRVCLCVAAALILFVVGILLLIYSPWAQEILRRGVVNKMSGGQTELTLDYFRLSFPLDIDAGGIAMLNNGDTLAAASSLHASIKLLPLLKGKAVVESLSANDARYTMGAPDSLMYMTIAADSLGVNPASVLLSDMAISLEEAAIRGGRLGIF
ncbi:MAG: hypothetical protein K2F79_00465, partial [Muribaculaceae bacterium]|nr:hypothetical protein [Muribaculaceae bacterium]